MVGKTLGGAGKIFLQHHMSHMYINEHKPFTTGQLEHEHKAGEHFYNAITSCIHCSQLKKKKIMGSGL